MDFIPINRVGAEAPLRHLPTAEHPELDQPDGELAWDRWLEGLQRLETALLITAG